MLAPMNSVPDQFLLLKQIWIPILFNYANDVFIMLAEVEVGLAALLWMLQHEGVENIGAGLLKKCLWLGFMYAVLFHADTWIPAIIRSFMEAGQQAAHVDKLNPAEVFTQGLGVGVKMLKAMAGWGILTRTAATLAGVFAALVTIIAHGIIAIELGITLIESYIVTGAGVFLLGFAAFRGTAALSEHYLSYVVAVGLKLFMLYLIVGAGGTLPPLWQGLINEAAMLDFSIPFTVAFSALMYAAVAHAVPRLAGALASGTVGLGFGDVLGATVMTMRVGGAAATAAAAPVAGAQLGIAAGRYGKAVAQSHGGSVGGALRGGLAAGGALSKEALAAAVPRLHRATQHIQGQTAATQNPKKDDDHEF